MLYICEWKSTTARCSLAEHLLSDICTVCCCRVTWPPHKYSQLCAAGSAIRSDSRYIDTEVRRRTFSLPHGQQTVLVAVAERPLGYRLKVPGVNSAAGNRVAALTHAGVVTQTPFVQVRVGQSVAAGDPLHLKRETHRSVSTYVHWSTRSASSDINRSWSTRTNNTSVCLFVCLCCLDSPDQTPACDRAGEPPRVSLRQTACRAPTATAEEQKTWATG